MNNHDIKVRIINNYTSSSTYIATIDSSQKRIINQDHNLALTMIKRFKRLQDTEFDIKFFLDETIENGYPHTMGKTIMLPLKHYFNISQKQRIILLIHEFMHIYQRYNPFEFNHLLIHTLGLKVDNFIDAYYKNTRRLNPDINALLYDEGDGHKVMLYNNNPNKLSDAYIHSQYTNSIDPTKLSLFSKLVHVYTNKIHIQSEHPYEVIACITSYMIYENDNTIKEIYNWMNN